MSMIEVVKQVSEAVTKEGNSQVVFGPPVKLENKSVIPVASVRLGAGGGGISPSAELPTMAKILFSGGGGGGFDVQPVGFIHERGDEVVFTPIHLEVRSKPILSEAASGLGRLIDWATSTASAMLTGRRKQPTKN